MSGGSAAGRGLAGGQSARQGDFSSSGLPGTESPDQRRLSLST
jgi:hypothetical protein